MRLFLDTSVLLAAAGSANGSSHALFSSAATQGWVLICSPYALNEVLRNLPKLAVSATTEWLRLRPQELELERRGHHPLRFFRKCLEGDDARLPALIREEIQAR